MAEVRARFVGGEILVNTTTLSDQYLPQVTGLSDGSYVVVWETNDGGDGSATAIRGRIVGIDGTGGADFIINTTTAGVQSQPTVTGLPDGRFFVSWTSADGGDGSGTVIRGRFLDADGTGGNDFIVNTTTSGDQVEASVFVLSDGRIVATWRSEDGGDGSGSAIRGRILNADGTGGSDFIINTTTITDQYAPAVAALPDGGFVVTWWTEDGGDGSSSAVRGRILAADGTGLNDFIVDTSVLNNQDRPSVAVLEDGRIIVTWRSFDGGDGQGTAIRGRILDSDGTGAGDFIVNTSTASDQLDPTVTGLSDGRIAITWYSYDGGDGTGSSIRGRILEADGTGGADFTVNTTIGRDQVDPTIASLPDGRFIITWTTFDGGEGSGTAIRSQVFEVSTDENSPPTDLLVDGASVMEGAANGTVVATLMGVDPDANENLAFSLDGDADGRFAIVGNQIVVRDGSLLRFDQSESHNVVVSVRDAFGEKYTEVVIISLEDNEGPAISGPVTLPAIDEDTFATITSAQLLANANDLEGDALSVANLAASSGTLTNTGNGTWSFVPDADDDTEVVFSYTVGDGINSPVAATASLDLLPVEEPVLVTLTATFISENAGYDNTFGWYNSATGVGGVLFGSVQANGGSPSVVPGVTTASFQVAQSEVANIRYFLIPNGAALQGGSVPTGAIEVVQLPTGEWAIADSSGTTYAGANAPALFSDASKNPFGGDNVSSASGAQTPQTLAGDTADGPTGLMYWHDLPAFGSAGPNGDYTNLVVKVDASGGTVPVPAVYSVSGGAPASEGGSLTFTVSRTGSTPAESVAFSLGGSAAAGSDYMLPQLSVAFAAGETQTTVTIATIDDQSVEGNETVSLTLTSASNGGTINDGAKTAAAIISDNDTAGGDTVTLTATVLAENAGYDNTFGWYNSETGVGGVLFSSMVSTGVSPTVTPGETVASFEVLASDIDAIHYFLIPNGGALQPGGVPSGVVQIVQLSGGEWAVADANGTPYAGANAAALFTEAAKNPFGGDNVSSISGNVQTPTSLAGDTVDGPTGELHWSDVPAFFSGGQIRDYGNIVIGVEFEEAPAESIGFGPNFNPFEFAIA